MTRRRRSPIAAARQGILLGWLDAALNSLSEKRARAMVSALRPAERAESTESTESAESADPARKQLLVDVSVISRGDAGTGVQRAVRALLHQLIEAPPRGYDVRPVEAGRWHRYRYAGTACGKLVAGPGDVYLGLDLATHNVIRHYRQFNRWKKAGAKFVFVVYDLLPASHPEWFSRKAARAYLGWIRNLAIYADAALCISRAVRDELEAWLASRLGVQQRSVSLGWFHLGGDLQASLPSAGRPPEFDALLARIAATPSVLMTGTIEPRKGHALALAAFEALWRSGRDVMLVIVGRAGWGVDALLDCLRRHPESGRRLVWLDEASDEVLCALYRACAGLLMASEGEGFGLPIAEAARFGLPVLARELPVFQEVAGEHACYFRGGTPEAVAAEIGAWLELVRQGRAPASAGMKLPSWEESARMLRDSLVQVLRERP